MNKVFFNLLNAVALSVLLFTVGCSDNGGDDPTIVTKENISAKWAIADANSLYSSIEFNESGNYIIIKNQAQASELKGVSSDNNADASVLFGTYQIISDNVIKLNGFGTITVSSITESSFKFTVKLESSSTVKEYISTRNSDIANSSRTDLLCRTWKITKWDGEDVAGTEKEIGVIFSKAGTYFVFNYSNNGIILGIANWKWKNSAETILRYEHGEGYDYVDGEIEIVMLNSDKLEFTEDFGPDGISEYVLVPVI